MLLLLLAVVWPVEFGEFVECNCRSAAFAQLSASNANAASAANV